MLAKRLALLVSLAVAASGAGAAAQPRHTRTVASTATHPGSAVATAYIAGKQALVGLHAPSSDPVPRDEAGRPMLSLVNINRGESIAVPANGDDGGFASADLDRIAHLLRAASGDEHPIDPRTLSLVYRIQTHFETPEIRVVSGYRVPKPTSHSNHGKGRATDIIVPGVADEDVARFAREMGFVGIGIYPSSQFVHVDIRAHSYFWVDYSGPHMRNRERGILGDLAARSDHDALARGQAPVEPYTLGTNVDSALQAHGLLSAATPPPEEDDEEDN